MIDRACAAVSFPIALLAGKPPESRVQIDAACGTVHLIYNAKKYQICSTDHEKHHRFFAAPLLQCLDNQVAAWSASRARGLTR
jgi:hypothetical protein